jgi:methyltransferase-like protein/2-polyprenyl-3-methyl-5-hydroxy-6-metoxy-1,4-benzoquinol methylase
MSAGELTSYDQVPYESLPYAQTHPDRLATVATLLGMKPRPVACCRVLELGCAGGGNLIPMALALPESQFLGLDLSARQVESGRQTIDALGLKNVRLETRSILDVGDDLGQFDYIICHGVYSWVPTVVQHKILEVSDRNLAPDGVAYVSYNTYPGWHLRGMIRDMMAYHTRHVTGALRRVVLARALLEFLAGAVQQENNPYGQLLQGELELLRRCGDSYLFHEHLEDDNTPTYFYEFAERAEAAGLQYLGEVDLSIMAADNFPPEVQKVLRRLAPDTLHLEQYMDFLRNRTFRQTLLCHQGVSLDYTLRAERLLPFHVASPARPVAPQQDLRPGVVERFAGPDGVTVKSADPLVKAALHHLAAVWPRAVPFAELRQRARARLSPEADPEQSRVGDTQILGQCLLTCYLSDSRSLVHLHTHPPHCVVETADRPAASPLARLQATTSNKVTTLRHQSVLLDDFIREVLLHLDGDHDRAALLRAVEQAVLRGRLALAALPDPAAAPARRLEVLGKALDQALSQIAANALLIR